MMFEEKDLKALEGAMAMVLRGEFRKVTLNDNLIVYRVPSGNPNKFTIRVDLKVNKEEN